MLLSAPGGGAPGATPGRIRDPRTAVPASGHVQPYPLRSATPLACSASTILPRLGEGIAPNNHAPRLVWRSALHLATNRKGAANPRARGATPPSSDREASDSAATPCATGRRRVGRLRRSAGWHRTNTCRRPSIGQASSLKMTSRPRLPRRLFTRPCRLGSLGFPCGSGDPGPAARAASGAACHFGRRMP